jgi:4-hydroxybenzoyl-CoA thioesterase
VSVDGLAYVSSRRPFVVHRRVRWGDCDPAGVVYTGRFPEYVLDAVSLFFRDLGGEPWHLYAERIGVDTPCKALSFEFSHALWPEDEFDMSVSVAAIRTRSFDLGVSARRADGIIAFTATFSPVCISRTERRAVAIPEALRRALESRQ